jgi:predicted RND superfamily exporter protein
VNLLRRVLVRLVPIQLARPGVVLFIALLTMIPAGYAISGLRIRTAFGELLPENKPSVIELKRANERLASSSTLVLVAESQNTALLKRFVDELTPELRKLPRGLVASVDPGPAAALRFFERNKHLYASLKQIEQLHEEVVDRYDEEVGRKTGTWLDLEDEPRDKKPRPPITADTLRERFRAAMEEQRKAAPGQDGYYLGENGHLIAIMIRTTLASLDTRAFDLQNRVAELVRTHHYDRVDPKFHFAFTGNLITSTEQYRAVTNDLVAVGATGVALVLAVVFFFFLRVRALVALGVSILMGCAWSLAFARLTVGYLNTATGFLVSIIAGNGINAMVIYMARYLEARRHEQLDVPAALRKATLDTHEATLAVVGVAVVSYGALMTTDFRGFRHFGIIGGAGMLLCWIATYTVLPAILVLSERVMSLSGPLSFLDRLAGLYGRPFTWLAKRRPAPIAAVGLALGFAGLAATAAYFLGDPMEYNLKNILNDDTEPTSAGKLGSRVNRVAGRLNQSGRAILVDRLDQVMPVVHELERRRDSAPAGKKPFEKVVSVFSLLPSDQERKIELLNEIVDRLDRARKHGLIKNADWAELEPHIPRQLRPLAIDDLPDLVVRPFQEKNGDKGKILYVSPTNGKSLNDAHYLMLWANAFRTIRLPNGEVIRGTGDAVVFSDMLLSISEDAPRVAFASLGGTLLVILLAFRGRRSGWVALGTLLCGISWLVGSLYLGHVKMNFLNFVAIPIAIGAGADYAINIMKRREIEGDAGVERAFIETGGAVVACSMTTLCGYTALLFSINGAVRSFGLAAAIGELATQISAMVVLPSALFWWAARQRRRAKVSASAEVVT